MAETRIGAVILAAGKSTRMRSDLPKVVHDVCGRPMLAYVLEACREAGVAECVVIVGHEKDRIVNAFSHDSGLVWVEQPEQRGTGHAVMCCREQIAGRFEHVLVLCGDGPLIRGEIIERLIKTHIESSASATLATATLDDPLGYGRIVRDEQGDFRGIVEHSECTPEQLAISEVNPSYYCFDTARLLAALDQTSPDNAKKEYYLTDVFAIMIEAGQTVRAVAAVPAEDVLSINSRADLARVNGIMQQRVQARVMGGGVSLVDPGNTWIDAPATVGADTTIHPFVHIAGDARVGSGCAVGPFAHLPAGAVVADGAVVGPNLGGGP